MRDKGSNMRIAQPASALQITPFSRLHYESLLFPKLHESDKLRNYELSYRHSPIYDPPFRSLGCSSFGVLEP